MDDAIDRGRIRDSIHEAGHCIGGVLFGGKVSSAVVGPERVRELVAAHNAAAEHGDSRGITGMLDLSQAREPGYMFAGPWAEARWQSGRYPTNDEIRAVLADGSGRHCDRQKIRAANVDLTDLSDTGRMLERCWPAVQTLAKRLYTHGEVRHRHVLDALGIVYDERAAFALANVRAGLRGVPALT